MGYFTDVLRSLWATLENAGRPAVTQQYPNVIRPRPERFHTSFALLHDETGDEGCIGCLACERICPSGVITLKQAAKRESPFTHKKRGYADDFTLDLTACMGCELCIQVCPTDALVMLRRPEAPGHSREDLVLTMARLYANETHAEHGWSNGTRLMEMQDPKRGMTEPAPVGALSKPAAAGGTP